MMTETARLLSRSGNYAVVQLPDRNFPGIVVQGDSAHALLAQVDAILKLARKYEDADLNAEIEDLRELLSDLNGHFEIVCAREGIKLPYPKEAPPRKP